MDCKQACQLFDAYLDGELSARLATEFGAHRVRCPECRRALALLEVAGHVIGSDEDPVTLRAGFSERLLACMEAPGRRWRRFLPRVLYIGGPLAAAAVIALAFAGFFDRSSSIVAGQKDDRADGWVIDPSSPDFDPWGEPLPEDGQEEVEGRSVVDQAAKNWDKKKEAFQSLQDLPEVTIRQGLEILDQLPDESRGADHFPGANVAQPESEEPAPAEGDSPGAP